MTPTSGTPNSIIMPVEVPDIAMIPEDIMLTSEAFMPLVAFRAGGQRYCNQSCSGQCFDNKSSISVHDRSFQSEGVISDKRRLI
jgi:hypothetical protein